MGIMPTIIEPLSCGYMLARLPFFVKGASLSLQKTRIRLPRVRCLFLLKKHLLLASSGSVSLSEVLFLFFVYIANEAQSL